MRITILVDNYATQLTSLSKRLLSEWGFLLHCSALPVGTSKTYNFIAQCIGTLSLGALNPQFSQIIILPSSW
ncbi:MAG: hypothetical protein RQ842_08530, partial [Vulcanisaeta sp.]|nr:hypothetical protein [Vulcanisaeta sp.]